MNYIPRILTGLLLVVITLTLLLTLPAWISALSVGCITLYTLTVEWPQFHMPYLTPVYPIAPLLLLIVTTAYGNRVELLWLIITIAAHDTGAYISGNLWGYHRLLPTVSPKKTWEGVFGGIICSLITAYGAVMLTGQPALLQQRGILSFCVLLILLNSAGIAGDLFESWLKRRVGIKDSGTILPGHGGILDRIDSLLFALPTWILITIVLN